MSNQIKRVDYFHTTIKDEPGGAFQILDQFAQQGVNLLAFSAVPSGPATTQLTIFPGRYQKSCGLGQTGRFANDWALFGLFGHG